MLKKTILNKTDPKSNSLKTTVPKVIVNFLKLKLGNALEWDIVPLVNNTLYLDNGNEVEQVVVIRKAKTTKKG